MDTRFLPTTLEEMHARGWDELDVILVSGDSYIDSPFIGAAVIGRVLEKAGYRVGIIAQPDTTSNADITRLGEPRLFWGVTGGSVDSMVANYTANKKSARRMITLPAGEQPPARPGGDRLYQPDPAHFKEHPSDRPGRDRSLPAPGCPLRFLVEFRPPLHPV